MFKPQPINDGLYSRILLNLIFCLKKVNVFDIQELISLQKKVYENPEGVMDRLITLLKESKRRRIVKEERKF